MTVLGREKRIYKGKSDDLGVEKVIRNSENQGGSKEKLKFRVFQYTDGILARSCGGRRVAWSCERSNLTYGGCLTYGSD